MTHCCLHLNKCDSTLEERKGSAKSKLQFNAYDVTEMLRLKHETHEVNYDLNNGYLKNFLGYYSLAYYSWPTEDKIHAPPLILSIPITCNRNKTHMVVFRFLTNFKFVDCIKCSQKLQQVDLITVNFQSRQIHYFCGNFIKFFVGISHSFTTQITSKQVLKPTYKLIYEIFCYFNN